jgi:hypothetical protein
MDAHYREADFFGNSKSVFFSKKNANWMVFTQAKYYPKKHPTFCTPYPQLSVDKYLVVTIEEI